MRVRTPISSSSSPSRSERLEMADRLTIARPYARAAFAEARENGGLAPWADALQAAAVVVKDSRVATLLDDPRVNFAISTRGRKPGLDHLGIQVESQEELHEVYGRLREAGGNIIGLSMHHRHSSFFDANIDIEVKDARHLTHIAAALRACPSVETVERARG